MTLTYEFLCDVARTKGGAFYIFDENRFTANYLAFRDGLRRHYPNAEVAYAFKANYMPAIGEVLARLDGMGEVVSGFEYEIASGYLLPERLIFNGPVKRHEDIVHALRSGSQVNLDSLGEVRQLVNLPWGVDPIDIGLRISAIKSDGQQSRFGLVVEEGELEHALALIDSLGKVNVASLHCHLATRDKAPQDFVARLEYLWAITKRLNGRHRLRSINIGGGFFGEIPETLQQQFACPIPSIGTYTETIGKAFSAMHPERKITLIIEPGVSVVANTMCLAVRVVDVRERNGGRQALLDTSINSINPTHSPLKAPLSVVSARGDAGSRSQVHTLVGNTCMEHDVIDSRLHADLQAGDFILFENRGAYSINYTPDFIHPAPAIVDRHGKVLKIADSVTTSLSAYTDRPAHGGR
ncbi:diaminopimelate decarboxylase [Franzmannia pantelleriensis]|uniref:Diaminopimelate decarboxylase n=2 Tax=Franzmannia pantelleriensis TaxID=48727 RepID=A0A1G9ES43_9GAMM|nr:diaminopimelate decarboxylase [Halomonas pantelleriensis]